MLGYNITGDDCTVLARANGRYIDAQVSFVCCKVYTAAEACSQTDSTCSRLHSQAL